ncbi:hypothetical protein B0O99DRAFT_635488 [Bisporella sp. PMI_857]|nr:hypothetical protein B0O99DRAFT_635488 [Bisporella sp. PMI_857]
MSSILGKGQRPPLRDRPAYPRKRAIRACRTCRQRRTKCDNEQPSCTSCSALGVECGYQATDKSTFDSASLAILSRLDELEGLIRSGGDHHLSSLVPAHVEPNLTLEAARAEVSVIYHINIETVLAWPVLENCGFDQRINLKNLLQPDGERWTCPKLSIGSDFELDNGAKLLQSFLDNVHIYNPILELTKVQCYARDVQFNGLGWDAKSCLMLLTFALGSISDPLGEVSSENSINGYRLEAFRQAEAFFSAAQKRMGAFFCSNEILDAQCFFLAGVYLMATLRPIEAWKMFVHALACCQCFPTPTSSDTFQNDELLQSQESLYWTCFKSELELRLELGVGKPGISDFAYPHFFPSPPKSIKTQNQTAWYFYLAEIALRRLGNRILNYLYQYDPSRTSVIQAIDVVSDFEQQAQTWRESLPTALKLNLAAGDFENADPAHAALRFILTGHLLDCYEMMYWPFIVDSIHSTTAQSAEAQVFVQKGLELCVQRIVKNKSGFYHHHHGTWLMVRSCTRSALVLLSAARSHLSALLDPSWKGAVAQVYKMLRYWKNDLKDVPYYLDILEKLAGETISTIAGTT